jgi:hypothetical protein
VCSCHFRMEDGKKILVGFLHGKGAWQWAKRAKTATWCGRFNTSVDGAKLASALNRRPSSWTPGGVETRHAQLERIMNARLESAEGRKSKNDPVDGVSGVGTKVPRSS